MKKKLLIIGLILGVVLVIAACQPAVAPTQAPAALQPACPPAAPCPVAEAGVEAPFAALWSASGHADKAAEAFRHWDGESPAEVPVACTKCHSGAGLVEFMTTGKNEAVVAAADVTGITCTSCHNDASFKYTAVTFPSGVVISGLGREALCMTCHQGRESKVSVDAQIEKFAITDLDAVVAPIKDAAGKDVNFGFRNVHYFAAAATLYGSQVHGGYEYDGKSYDYKFDHIAGYDTCIDCHDSHSLEVKVEQCALCHEGVAKKEDLKNIRMLSSNADYDGDGNVTEGMAFEIEGLQVNLLAQLQAYAKDKTGVSVVYDPAAYPYWFADAEGDGVIDQKDGANIAFSTWTARLLKAAYNYQVSIKDPGAFAHGNKYIVQLLIDSIEDLGGDVTKLNRLDAGHFDGSSMAFRDWDADGEVPYNCAKCHSATGLPEFFKAGGTVSISPTGSVLQSGIGAQPISNSFTCYTCHDEANWPKLYEVAQVPFPSGTSLSLAKDADGKNVADPNNICISCHQGRQSGRTVAFSGAGAEADPADKSVTFQNVHYASAGATLFGSAAGGMFQYPGKEYAGQFAHVEGFTKCSNCHDVHKLGVKVDACKGCHGTDDVKAIRAPGDTTDYDGDGNTTEGIAGEVATMQEKVYAAIQAYAKDKLGVGIVYDTNTRPYFFLDADGDGKADKDADGKLLPYIYSPRLTEAAYNLHYSYKDAGAAMHNGVYVLQVLYDTIQDLKGSVTGLTRP
jgi:hypothetical protein